MKKHQLAAIAFISIMAYSCDSTPKLGKDPVDEVIAAMTLEEKVNFVIGTERLANNAPEPAPGTVSRPKYDKAFQDRLDSCASEEERNALIKEAEKEMPQRVPGAAGNHYAVERLGIRPIVYADGPAGLRIDPKRDGDSNDYYCTAFPVGASLASSWDTELVTQVAKAIGNEVLEYGVDILLAPAMNIHRNPLCGRNFEYYSEDPVLAGNIAAAYINGIQSQGVGVSLKHFAVNSQETYRNGVNARLSQKALREIYLKGFEIAVKKSHPWTIMSSYNRINGTFASENRFLLTDILRKEWKFDGFVMTDWWAEGHGDSQIAAGNDLLMPGTKRQHDEIIEAIKDGTLYESHLDESVKRIMNVMLRTPTYRNYKYSSKPDLKAHAQIARKAAAEGMVLLENHNGALPLRTGKAALFGNGSYDTLVGGSGSGNVNRKYKVSIADGLLNANIAIDKDLSESYQKSIRSQLEKEAKEYFWKVPVSSEIRIDKEMAKKAIASSDIAIITISRMAGEGGDRKVEKGDYLLSDIEQDNISLVCSEAHKAGKKAILVLNMGGIIDLSSIHNMPDAILQAWMGGQEMGNSVADVLTGKVNPCGKLPMSWALSYYDYPSSENFPESDNNPAVVNYKEDVFVGYRYFDSHNKPVLYPFGYGLSYTSFEYSGLKVEKSEEYLTISFTVKNTGDRDGKEIAQVYIGHPETLENNNPVKELKAFAKTKKLKAGQSQRISLQISLDDLAVYDENRNAWAIDNGAYKIFAGSSVNDIRLSDEIFI